LLTNNFCPSLESKRKVNVDTLQVREYGEKIGDVLKATTDRNDLLQQVASTKKVLPGVPISDFETMLTKTSVDSEFLDAVSTASLTQPQVTTFSVG